MGKQFDFHLDFWALPNLFQDTAIHFNKLYCDLITPHLCK